jgi:hypothetical protein
MKNLILSILTILLVTSINLLAQDPAGAVNREKLGVFSNWAGEWTGEGFMQMGPGAPKKSSVHEKIEYRLEGAVLLVEGTGKSIDDATKKEIITHHALAVLSWDDTSKEYKFKSYLHDGKSTDAWFKLLEENKYAWGFEIPNGKIRYSITIDGIKKTWNEIGEFSKDGTQWFKFFEMNLSKK